MSRRASPATVPVPPADPLHTYRAKRNAALTPEPFDGAPAASDSAGFVVQKHWASRLHYDFRLELDGTLKSWAVPKGPSLDPAVKRMAVPVEDHPLTYAGFEGTIPAGQYGAGRVIVWDAGTWVPLQDPRQGLASGHLKFELRGHKLRGRWALVRLKDKGEGGSAGPAWLLIKEKDEFARASATFSVVDERPGSVKATEATEATVSGLPPAARPGDLPPALRPQLATLAARPPADAADWLYEIKYDGYRLLVRHDAAGTQLLTRNGHDWTARLQPLQRVFQRLGLPPGWYDGEIVVPGPDGVPDFAALQQVFETQRTDEVVLYLFDLPYADGHDLRQVPLQERRAYLQGLLASVRDGAVRFSEAIDGPPGSVLASACRMGLEGVVAKRRDSLYRSTRSADWLKLKCGHRQEFVIGGYTAGRGTRAGFGALLLGVHDEQGVLQYVGDVGTGFSGTALKQIRRALDAISRPRSPFAAGTAFDGQPRWVAPTLVAEVSFAGWTRAGHVRHAVFRGLRDDQDPARIVREAAARVPPAATEPAAVARALPRGMRVTNPQRVIDPRSGTTKLELLQYYGQVGALMMKHLKGRPVSLLRAPSGVDGEQFFQKHAPAEALPGIRPLDPALSPGHPPMLEVAGASGLLSAAQWNVVEFHTHNATAAHHDRPDRLVFDLDPGEGVAWPQVQQAAELMHAFLQQLGLPSFLKTSGGKGLHVVVPLKRLHDWDTAKGFAQAVVQHMARTIPQRFVARSGPKNRVGRIFIDYLRNGRDATTVCAWSARARPGLGISVPVAWSELPTLRGGDHWTVKTVQARLAVGNQPWAGYARAARGLRAALSALGLASTPG